jgi:ribosomal protein L30/L7E
LLEKIGKGVIRPLTVPQLRDMLDRLP